MNVRWIVGSNAVNPDIGIPKFEDRNISNIFVKKHYFLVYE